MTDQNSRYVEALAKLYGSDKPHTCQHPGCRTVILKSKQYCMKHRGNYGRGYSRNA